MRNAVAKRALRLVILVAFILSLAQTSFGYSVLTHQAIIDSVWEDVLKPLLLKRFPHATAEELREAHANAYGGAIIQDMGYYPFGSKSFTDFTHYVRSGDFIKALIAESQDLNEYAFALGALAHYAADNSGHSIGTNRAVPIIYPKLRAKHGDEVTYAEHAASHIKTEFAFDVIQVARGRYAPEAYRDFIGFKVSKEVLKRAFARTYSLELKDMFKNLDLAIGSYRRTVSTIIPQMTRIAWEAKKDEIEKANPGITRDKFIYNLSRAGYEKEWGREYEKPGFFSKVLAFFVRIAPKVGPLKAFAFEAPPPEAERRLMESFNATLDRYRGLLNEVRSGKLDLENRDFDTGRPTRAGEYELADEAYAKLLEKLEDKNFENVTPELRSNILAFYGDLSAAIATKKDKGDWRDTLRALDRLKAAPSQSAGIVPQ